MLRKLFRLRRAHAPTPAVIHDGMEIFFQIINQKNCQTCEKEFIAGEIYLFERNSQGKVTAIFCDHDCQIKFKKT